MKSKLKFSLPLKFLEQITNCKHINIYYFSLKNTFFVINITIEYRCNIEIRLKVILNK